MSETVTKFAIEWLARGAGILAVCWIFDRLMRRHGVAARVMKRIWAAGFAIVLAAPLLAAALAEAAPGWTVALPTVERAGRPAVPAPLLPDSARADRITAPVVAANRVAAEASEAARFEFNISAHVVALAVWAFVAALLMVRQAAGVRSSRRLAREARVLNCAERPVRISETVTTPMAVGLIRPVILVPAGFETWPGEEQRAVLAHEGEHVRTRDGFVSATARLVAALCWPNPLCWIGLRRLNRWIERSADEAVLAAGASPTDYAALLHRVASGRAPLGMSASVAMAAMSGLRERVTSIMAWDGPRRARLAGAAGAVLLGAVLIAASVPAAVGDDTVESEQHEQGRAVTTDAARASMLAEVDALWDGNARVTRIYDISPALAREGLAGSESPIDWLRGKNVAFADGDDAIFDEATATLVVKAYAGGHEELKKFLGIPPPAPQVLLRVARIKGSHETIQAAAGMDIEKDLSGAAASVLTEALRADLVDRLMTAEGIKMSDPISIVTRSETTAVLNSREGNGPQLHLAPIVGPDNYTINLSVMTTEVNSARVTEATSVTVCDGQTAAVKSGRGELCLISVRLINPAGVPVNSLDAPASSEAPPVKEQAEGRAQKKARGSTVSVGAAHARMLVEIDALRDEDMLVTRIYDIWPALARQSLAGLESPRDWLSGKGIALTGGGDALYDEGLGLLFVKAGRDGHEGVKKFLDGQPPPPRVAFALVTVTGSREAMARLVETDALWKSFLRDVEWLEGSSMKEREFWVTSVLTEPQRASLMEKLIKVEGVALEVTPWTLVKPTGRGWRQVRFDGFYSRDPLGFRPNLGVLIGEDGYTLDLNISFKPTGEGGMTTALTMWDGQAVVIRREAADDEIALHFVSVRLVDDAADVLPPLAPETDGSGKSD